MNRLIYVETSIPSFYFETRPDHQNQARREWTREWWDYARWTDTLVTSAWVLIEAEETPEPKRSDIVGLLNDIPLLAADPAIDRMVQAYLDHKLMPADADGDARHLAIATFWQCDVLLTWNCRHLANANKLPHIEAINSRLGCKTPQLLTPYQLLELEP
jgi:hypothetical protein